MRFTMWDFRRLPSGDLALRQLIEALAEESDLAERHYLELKEDLDLAGDKAHRAKVVKFILGAANRMPDVAANYFSGHAVLAIGTRNQKGIPPVDPKDLASYIEPFLPATCPKWDLRQVPASEAGRFIVLVIVDPPVPGDPPFACMKDGKDLDDGAIYIRGDGETRTANGRDIQQLAARSRAAASLDATFSVGIATPAILIDDVSSLVAEYVATTHEDLLSDVSASDAEAPIWAPVSPFTNMPEKRTPQMFQEELGLWAAKVEKQALTGVPLVAAAASGPTRVVLANDSDTYLEGVQLRILLGDLSPIRNNVDELSWPPVPPRRWGAGLVFSTGARSMTWLHAQVFHEMEPWSVTDGREGFEIRVRVGELRPRESQEFPLPYALLCMAPDVLPSVAWEITAKGHHQIFKGTSELAMRDPTWLQQVVADHLGLEEDRANGS